MARSRDILRALERAAAEHVAWLLRVHTALMFPEKVDCWRKDWADPADWCLADFPELEDLRRLRTRMHLEADALLASARKGAIDHALYSQFMSTVDAYSREARRVEGHFQRLLVETDPLTGLWNRQGMLRDLRREWNRSARTKRPVCVAIADLDHFKIVNDTWGHAVGDKVLCLAAQFFCRRLRPYDVVYRCGGEEFLFCLPDTSCASAKRVLNRLCTVMAKTPLMFEDGSRLAVTCSIGLAELRPDQTVEQSIEAADRALYAAKAAGRNQVFVSEHDGATVAVTRREAVLARMLGQ